VNQHGKLGLKPKALAKQAAGRQFSNAACR
jgi:hypothetical protein